MASARSNGNTPGPAPRTPPLSSLSSLTRQSSIYTLTLEELQNAVNNEPGKSFGSMNMDEFLKNIWTAEESQAMAAAMGGGEGNGSSSGSAQPQNLQRQASLSIPKNLEGKTVDEVWREIHRSGDQSAAGKVQQRQMTLGDITLEDFLAKAGVIRDESEGGPAAISSSSSSSIVTHNAAGIASKVQTSAGMRASPQQVDWNYPFKQQHQQLLQQQHLVHQQQAEAAAAAASASAYASGRRLPSSSAPTLSPVTPTAHVMDVVPFEVLASSPLSPSRAVLTPDSPTRGKKRMFEAHGGRAVEQRQKRMIKNRESAARSRARKQAYTVELEAEVTQLKDENSQLLHQQNEEMEERRKWLMENLIPVTSQFPRPVRVLRRTRTTSW